MASTEGSIKQKTGAHDPVMNIVEAVDEIFARLRIDDAVFHNPSYNSDAVEKVCGLTHTYLKPVRIGRKAVLGDTVLYYGRKVDLLPRAYELVEFDAASDIAGFFEDRIARSLTEYMSIHSGSHQLNIDIREGVIVNLSNIGFKNDFKWLENGKYFRKAELNQIIQACMNR